MLRLTADEGDTPPVTPLVPTLLAMATVRVADDGLHAVWPLATGALQGRLDQPPGGKIAVILPLDEALELRALTAIRLLRRLTRRFDGSEPAPLSANRRARLVQTLRALDARADGACLRDIAEALFRDRIAGRAWQDSSLQARTKRLVRSGVALMRGGYRELLNPLSRTRNRAKQEPGDKDTTP